jgi:tRNA-2-methylthio-N6-dimethylallyladenosine synthase
VLGCSHACTFCIIPYRRGIERSRSQQEIVAEVNALVSQGIKEVMLLGQIVDRYGMDFPEPSSLAALLREINEIEGLTRIRFLTSHPNWMTDDLLHAVRDLEKVCPHLEIPVQAGNDEVLSNMRRGYTTADYYRLIDRVRALLPHAAIHTDIIVGFPGETEAQFDDTLKLIETVEFDKVHISKYSTRPKTVAARKMVDDVSEAEKSRRHKIIDQAQKEILTRNNLTMIGRTVPVLVEEKHKDSWRGRTPHNKIVFFNDDRDLVGKVVGVCIDRSGPFSLIGKALATA